jgi:opacity protein-like surface antigen
MGSLKPGATYVYERQGGTVYAREMGAPAEDRMVIGYDWELDNNPARVRGARLEDVLENQLWHDIRRAASGNEELKNLLERAKLLYYLSKNDDSET